ncbi:FMN-binding negative transcriptional regulator [Calidifontibacter terrae]
MPYLPDQDRAPDDAQLREFIDAHPLGSLVTHDGQWPDLDLIPFLPREGRLIGHVARANPLWRRAPQNVLVTFGPIDHYISPSWYPSKAEKHQVVPTWNYLIVHVRGRLEVHDDAKWKRAAVAMLTQRMESGREHPWKVGDAPADYVAQRLDDIVGISIEISSMVGKFKVSAARTPADRLGARDGIRAESGESELVERMGAQVAPVAPVREAPGGGWS